MSYPIDVTIPAGSHLPANDRPLIQQNFSNISQYVTVDHVMPGANGNGFHKQVTLNSTASPGAATDPLSFIYSSAGVASSFSNLFFKNQNAIFLLNCVKAFGVFTTASGAVTTFNNSYNCASISGSGQNYTITLNTNVVTGNNVIVLLTSSSPNSIGGGWSFTGGVLSLTGTGQFGSQLSFIILQA